MKTNLTKWMIALFCLFCVSTTVMADRDTPITVGQLPTKAQQILKKNFSAHKVALAKMESEFFDKSYDVIFTNGDRLEFDKNGNWKEVECKSSAVPAALIPSAIREYVKTNYPDAKIVKIELDRKEFEVKLSNRLEITFNSKFQVIDIDD